MKNCSRIVVCLAACAAAFVVQSVAFGATTNSVYNLDAITSFSVGKDKAAGTNAASVAFLSDGTCGVTIGTNDYTATYVASKSSVTVTLDPNSQAAYASNIVDFVLANVPAIPGLTCTVRKLTFSKISLKNGAPTKASASISTLLAAEINGKHRTKGLNLKAAFINWTLASGSNF